MCSALQQAVCAIKKSNLKGKRRRAVTTTANGDEIKLALCALQQDGVATRMACGALQNLLLSDQNCRAALDANAVPILIVMLLHHGTSTTVMMSGLSSLLLLTRINGAQLMHSDLLSLLMCAMRQHKSQWDVTALSLTLLVRLSATPKGRGLLYTVHAVEFMIDAMLTHPKNATIQSLGCELLRHTADDFLMQEQLLEMGAVEVVVDAVRQFPNEKELLQRALSTLCQLCETDQTRTLIAQVGGVAATLHAVDCNIEDLTIARHGCTLLWELTLCTDVRQQIVTADAKAVVKKILKRHSHDAVLIVHGRALLLRIAGRTWTLAAVCSKSQPSMHTA
eukprot:GGOE01007216.1.p1 GENE.GGOE01007216.1~~GGOE01007216.1.p1  ORF type:complete len:354 (-),score=113.02 GGOE01007216.1:178-1185(-)